jgi:hypothetical protein
MNCVFGGEKEDMGGFVKKKDKLECLRRNGEK